MQHTIFDFLVESYIEFGEHPADAMDRAKRRIEQIKVNLHALGTASKQGIRRPEIRSGLREGATAIARVPDWAKAVSIRAPVSGATIGNRIFR